MYFSRGNKISKVDGKLTSFNISTEGWALNQHDEPSHELREGGNCEGRCFKRGGTADTSSNFVGDVEARLSPCRGVGRWRTSLVVDNGSHLFLFV